MRILFVAFSDNITTIRWIAQLEGTGWDVHLFPSIRRGDHAAGFRNLTLHDAGLWRPPELDPSVRVVGLWPLRRGAWTVQRVLGRWMPWRCNRARLLAATIRRMRPDVVHTLETQHAGYLMLDACRYLGASRPPWIHSCWGSDLYFFRDCPEHVDRIRGVMGACDFLMADCRRDIELAVGMQFKGVDLGVFPGGGGYDLDKLGRFRQPGSPSERRTVAVKGYQSERYGGRGLVALQALHRCADLLGDYRVVVYCAQTESVHDVSRHIAATTAIAVDSLSRVPHNEVLGLMGRTRVHLAVSLTDGTPNAMLEAMALGAFPVQSDTESTAEWIRDGVNGLLVSPTDPLSVERALRRALTDDVLVDRAAVENGRIVKQRAEITKTRASVIDAYKRVAGV